MSLISGSQFLGPFAFGITSLMTSGVWIEELRPCCSLQFPPTDMTVHPAQISFANARATTVSVPVVARANSPACDITAMGSAWNRETVGVGNGWWPAHMRLSCVMLPLPGSSPPQHTLMQILPLWNFPMSVQARRLPGCFCTVLADCVTQAGLAVVGRWRSRLSSTSRHLAAPSLAVLINQHFFFSVSPGHTLMPNELSLVVAGGILYPMGVAWCVCVSQLSI